MTVASKVKILNLSSILLVIVLLLTLSSCSAIQAITHYFKSTDHFVPLTSDQRILYEAGAEKFAAEVALHLADAIKRVEGGHSTKFRNQINVYLCSTPESFKEMTGREVKAITYRKSVFLSPKVIDESHNIDSYLAHELSHLLLFQQIGGYKYINIPSWFTEGLATFVSNGGGAQKVTDSKAKEAIKSGNHFIPYEDAGIKDIFFPRYASYWGLKHHMFYRQCMLFVAYLKERDEGKYKKFLSDIHEGKNFAESFQQAFGINTIGIWKEFKKQLESET